MSRVYDIILITDLPIKPFDKAIEPYSSRGFEEVSNYAGGTKVMTEGVYLAAVNYLNTEVLIEIVNNTPYDDYKECSRIELLIKK